MNFTGICQRARIKLIIVIISLKPLTGRAEIVLTFKPYANPYKLTNSHSGFIR
jgi:hypothetical protein